MHHDTGWLAVILDRAGQGMQGREGERRERDGRAKASFSELS